MATIEQVKIAVEKVDQDLSFVTEDLGAISNELSASVQALQGQISALLQVQVDPVAGVESTPYTVNAGYNMIGYTGPNGINIEDAFALATGSNAAFDNLAVIKDQTGIFNMPGFGGSLTTLVNGRGYWLRNNGPAFTVNWGLVTIQTR
tara:strand:- start:9 stop:452 length:444 start_codon:yes stop_codon:yes gene_type:complete